ncbi:hypothetical protein [Limimaricola cinnabarinus]|uniref:hypothetical protein n=1 Tax=Limimaricola cinnabarinus TaxID=1125964 RepID=UPI002FE31319
MDRRLPLPLGAELLDICVNHVTNPIEGQDQPASMTEPRQYKRLNEADLDIPAEGFHEQLCGLEDNFPGR